MSIFRPDLTIKFLLPAAVIILAGCQTEPTASQRASRFEICAEPLSDHANLIAFFPENYSCDEPEQRQSYRNGEMLRAESQRNVLAAGW